MTCARRTHRTLAFVVVMAVAHRCVRAWILPGTPASAPLTCGVKAGTRQPACSRDAQCSCLSNLRLCSYLPTFMLLSTASLPGIFPGARELVPCMIVSCNKIVHIYRTSAHTCDLSSKPVCGKDGVEYLNKCGQFVPDASNVHVAVQRAGCLIGWLTLCCAPYTCTSPHSAACMRACT
jgi:hypothetical protein